MEKILLAIDAVNLDMAAVKFACYLGRLTRSKIIGVFLENLVNDQKPVLTHAYGIKHLDWKLDENSPKYQDKRKKIEANITAFQQACEKGSVKWGIHRDTSVPASEIISESRFADVIITDAATSFNKGFEGIPTEFVKDVLKKAECPVIIAPESFDGVDELIFTYDGSSSSVFAIKQFTYIFPELSDKKVMVLQVNEKGVWAEQDKHHFGEWLQNHYSSIGFEALAGNTNDKLFDHLFKRKNVFIVMGAYGRSAFSRFFRRSQADLLINILTQPIFVSHL